MKIQNERKNPIHGIYIQPNHTIIVYLTICTKDRLPWLASPDIHDLLRSVWQEAQAWHVGKYVIMPDHIHLFAGLAQDDISLERWITYWKSMFSKKHKKPEHRWQSSHWDTRLRSDDSYYNKWVYVKNNPVRQGLVQRSDQWPFQGEIFEVS
ncbi:transposase [bacterium]|nr:transposase [bacterium]